MQKFSDNDFEAATMALRRSLLAHAQSYNDSSGSNSHDAHISQSKSTSVSKLRVVLKKVFKSLDEDGNGSLSTDELRRFCLTIGMSDDKMLDLLIDQVDINR